LTLREVTQALVRQRRSSGAAAHVRKVEHFLGRLWDAFRSSDRQNAGYFPVRKFVHGVRKLIHPLSPRLCTL